MSNYNGSTTITYSIERYREPDGTYRLVKEDDDGDNVVELDLRVNGTACFTAGNYHGHPDNRTPDEGDVEIRSITLFGKTFNESDLTEDESESILEKINESVSSEDEEYFEEPDDQGYDDY